MRFKFIHFGMAVLVGLLFGQSVGYASQGDQLKGSMQKELWIGGHGYQAELTLSQISGVAGSGGNIHYKGHFPEDPDSWIRVSRLGDGWEGLAFVFNSLHTIRTGASESRMASFSFSHEEAPQCGMDHLHADASITPNSLASAAMARAVSASYNTLCNDKLDGACLMMELELAFDLQFQERFPSDFEDRAGSILNMVEGFYQAQFAIIFDTLSLTYMDSEFFSLTNNASDLLSDISSKRGNDRIPFLQSSGSIFHLITGRTFVDRIAGLAYVESVCGPSSFATGVSSANNLSSAGTAVIVAHELGHNLGSLHDSSSGLGQAGTGFYIEGNSCPEGDNIMTPTVDSSLNEFSQCSKDYITSNISSLSNVEQCFNFPADAGIKALAGNDSEVTEGSTYTGSFDVVYQDAFQPADRLAVEGSIGEGEGVLQQVTLNGEDCPISSGTSFSCPEIQAQSVSPLIVQVTAGSTPTLNLAKGVALVSNSGDVKDILAGNDMLMTQIAVAENTDPIPDEPAAPELPPQDSGGSSESTGSSSSNGGGGSMGWFLILAGLAGVARSRQRAV